MIKSIITDNWKKDVSLSSHELGTEKVTLRNRTLDLKILHSDDPKVFGLNPHED